MKHPCAKTEILCYDLANRLVRRISASRKQESARVEPPELPDLHDACGTREASPRVSPVAPDWLPRILPCGDRGAVSFRHRLYGYLA